MLQHFLPETTVILALDCNKTIILKQITKV